MSHNETSSTGCPISAVLPHDPVPFFSNGDVNFKAHDVGWLCCGIMAIVATITSLWLISKHLAFFYHPTEQRHIVRLLLMPVIYALCSFLSYYFYKQALYFQLLRDCYEAFVIAAFFFLLLSYLSNPPPSPADPCPHPYATKAERNAKLRSVFRDLHLKKWMWPLGWVKWRPAGGGPGEGEAFLWWMRVCIGQYVIVRPVSTLASVLGEATGYYCLASWSPKFVHVWSAAAITISVTVAMYCVLQLYWPLREPLKPYKPVLKFLCIKLVVFLTFWQEASLHFLITLGWIKDSEYWTAEEIVVGLAALLSCAEMVLFSFLHVRAFTYLPYRALAPPVAFDADGTTLTPDLPGLTGSPDLAPAAASEWPALPVLPSAPRDRPHPSLATPKLPKDFDASLGFAPKKADGLPLRHRTRRWPALKTCLNLGDLVSELRKETRFVARGGRIDNVTLLEVTRADDLEKVMGATRPSAGRPDSRNGKVCSGNGQRDTDIGSVVKELERPGEQQTRQREGRGERLDPLRPIGGTFEQLPRACQSMHQTNSQHPRRPPRLAQAPLAPPPPGATLVRVPAQSFGRQEPSNDSSVAASYDSGNHLPQTSVRPTSYVPPQDNDFTPLPPPFAHFPPTLPTVTSHSDTAPRLDSPAGGEAPLRRPAHRYVHSETTVPLLGQLSAPLRQDPAWTMAAPASRKSQGLPPGAAAPFS